MQVVIDASRLYNTLADMDVEERGRYLLLALANITSKVYPLGKYDWIVQQTAMIEQPQKTRQSNSGNYSQEFLKFWNAYPNTRKTGKGGAYQAWKKIKMDKGFLLSACLFAIAWQKETDSWKQGYVPMPATYLNQRRWEDEPPVHEGPLVEKYLDMNGVWQTRR